jgi:hypothetical protein
MLTLKTLTELQYQPTFHQVVRKDLGSCSVLDVVVWQIGALAEECRGAAALTAS